MKKTLFLLLTLLSCPPLARAACEPGVYGSGASAFVVLVPVPGSGAGLRYLFLDGRRGMTSDADSPVACSGDQVRVGADDGKPAIWPRIALRETDTAFDSVDTRLSGRLIGPTGDTTLPLVVMVHGSERTSALASPYAYALAAQGMRVFAYDKRGTGKSEGEYTQNFELLAADAAAALAHARTMAQGRIMRSGYYGGSQGGWVAPLAAVRAPADFVAVGFGLVASPIDEDRDQMLQEARAAGLGAEAIARIERLSQVTAGLLASQFTQGFDDLAALREEFRRHGWLDRIDGEYSGAILRTDNETLRRLGRARFDNLELAWDYDAAAVLRQLRTPLLWVLAAQDREAPIEATRRTLLSLAQAGKPIDLYVFPDTDHGMFEFTTTAEGERKPTRITDGYLRLLGDWIKQQAGGSYGRSQRLWP